MLSIAEIFKKPAFESSDIAKKEYVNFYPYATTQYEHNDVIRIPVHADSFLVQPSQSHLFIKGKISNMKPVADHIVSVSKNGYAFLFDSISLYLNGKKIDSCKNPGVTSSILGFSRILTDDTASTSYGFHSPTQNITEDGHFYVAYPLKYLLGFCDTYHKPIVCSDLELEMIRARSDDGVFSVQKADGTPATAVVDRPTVKLESVFWSMPKLELTDQRKVDLLKKINSDSLISVPFRTLNTFELQLPSDMSKTNWQISCVPLDEQPNWALIALQDKAKPGSYSTFNQCNLQSLQFHVNQTNYPTSRIELDWLKGEVLEWYLSYLNFRHSYLDKNEIDEIIQSPNKLADWKKSPIYVVELARDAGELTSRSSANLSLTIEAKDKFDKDTRVHVVLIQDKVIEYHPISKLVYTV